MIFSRFGLTRMGVKNQNTNLYRYHEQAYSTLIRVRLHYLWSNAQKVGDHQIRHGRVKVINATVAVVTEVTPAPALGESVRVGFELGGTFLRVWVRSESESAGN